MEVEIATIRLVTSMLTLAAAVLALLPALGKALRWIKEKRRK